MEHRRAAIDEVDRCLRVIQDRAVSEEELDCLIRLVEEKERYQVCLSLIVERIFEQIRKGLLFRWDFDANDFRHADRPKLLINSPWKVPLNWSESDKRRLLYDLLGCYYRRCVHMVNSFIRELELAESFDEIQTIKEEALTAGVLEVRDRKLSHCHSIPDSKHVFGAYQNAVERHQRRP